MTFTGYDFLSITAIGDLCIILIGVFGKFINKYTVGTSAERAGSGRSSK